jgi:VanZ family protein
MRFFITKITPLALWCALIFYLSSLPVQPILDSDALGLYNILLRKVVHVFEFGVLFVLARRCFESLAVQRLWVRSALSLLFSLAYAIFDEWHQTFVFGREGKPLDVLTDACGILLGFIAWKKMKKLL